MARSVRGWNGSPVGSTGGFRGPPGPPPRPRARRAPGRRVAQGAGAFVLPSVEEAFGVAYIEAMAAGVPAIGTRGEPGPEEIAASGGGMTLVPPGDAGALADAIRTVLADRAALGAAARANVEASFTWAQCGRATVAAYEDALR